MIEFSCANCYKTFIAEHPGYSVIYDKCQGKTCPDCGKIRKLGVVKVRREDLTSWDCVKCGKMSNYFLDSICEKCFISREEKKGCVCILKKYRYYYCSLCEEPHFEDKAILCKDCFKKKDVHEQRKDTFFRIILPTSIISLIIGFFLGWLFLVKLRRKKSK